MARHRRLLDIALLGGVLSLSACGTRVQDPPAEDGGAAVRESPAWRTEPGDVLVSIDGHPVRTDAEALRVVRDLPPDASHVEVVIERRGESMTLAVELRPR